MAATGNMAKTRQRLAAIVGAVVTNTKLGLANMSEGSEFVQGLATAPAATIEPARMTGTEYNQQTKDFEVTVKLFYGYSANEDFDYTAPEDLIEQITAALLDFSKYGSGESVPYGSISWQVADEMTDQDPHVVTYESTLDFKGAI
ncbi:MAG TPA: hypothetical protein VGP72_10470 [Planctomycetota bacterium]|jgi:hypothetical protein